MIKQRLFAFFLTAALLLCAASPPAWASDRTAACYYPVEVESYTAGDFDQPRIRKVYQLSLSDDPSGIPTADFVEYGRTFHLMEMTRKDEVGVATQPLTKTVTTDSSTGDLSEILKQLDPEITAETEDGYAGTLKLDYNSVQAEVKGYKTSTRNLSATRTYPNLSDADLTMVPKTIQEGGRTLNLADVQWSNSTDMEGEEMVVRYTATASYTGSVSSRYATGYTVTADYTGEVAKTNCETVLYTAIFGGMEIPQEEQPEELEPEREPESEPEQKPEEKPADKDVQDQPIVLGENRTRLLMIAAMIGCLLVLIPILLKSAKGKKRNSAKGKRRYD